MRLYQIFKKRSKRESLKAYKSIDELPVGIWNKLHDGGEVSLLLKEPVKDLSESQAKELNDIWAKIQEEHFNEFGITERFKEYLQILANINRYERRAILKSNPHLITFAKIEREKLKDFLADGDKVGFYSQLIAIEKYIGFAINDAIVTVRKYYTYVREYTEHVTRVNLEARKRELRHE